MPYAWRGANTQLVIAAPIDAGLQAPELGTAAIGLGLRATQKKVVAQTGRCSLAVHGATTSLRKVAQTGRLAVALVPDSALISVGIGTFTHVTVTRDYDLATGEAPTGVVYFTLSAWLENGGVTLVPAAVPAALDSLGQIAVSLAANDDAATTPVDSYYTVREAILGQAIRSYRVSVPHNVGPTVDLATLPVLS